MYFYVQVFNTKVYLDNTTQTCSTCSSSTKGGREERYISIHILYIFACV